jgi:hypothetical protein
MFQMGIWQNFEVPNRMLIRQAVSPIRKAVVADRHNPIAVITLSPTLYIVEISGRYWHVRNY